MPCQALHYKGHRGAKSLVVHTQKGVRLGLLVFIDQVPLLDYGDSILKK